MRDAYVAMGAVIVFVLALMFGCLGTAHASMQECLDEQPMIMTPREPEYSVLNGTELDQIDDEEESDVDHCYDPQPPDDLVIET